MADRLRRPVAGRSFAARPSPAARWDHDHVHRGGTGHRRGVGERRGLLGVTRTRPRDPGRRVRRRRDHRQTSRPSPVGAGADDVARPRRLRRHVPDRRRTRVRRMAPRHRRRERPPAPRTAGRITGPTSLLGRAARLVGQDQLRRLPVPLADLRRRERGADRRRRAGPPRPAPRHDARDRAGVVRGLRAADPSSERAHGAPDDGDRRGGHGRGGGARRPRRSRSVEQLLGGGRRSGRSRRPRHRRCPARRTRSRRRDRRRRRRRPR